MPRNRKLTARRINGWVGHRSRWYRATAVLFIRTRKKKKWYKPLSTAKILMIWYMVGTVRLSIYYLLTHSTYTPFSFRLFFKSFFSILGGMCCPYTGWGSGMGRQVVFFCGLRRRIAMIRVADVCLDMRVWISRVESSRAEYWTPPYWSFFFITIVITMGYTTRLRVCLDLGLHTVSVDDVLYEIIQIAYALIVVYQCFLLLEVLYTRLGNSI